jgi:hydroxymethylglutaryl-CoA lyase
MKLREGVVKMINICEVGPRDGLQNEKKIINVEDKVKLINQCAASGVKKIEVASFVNPKVVPQMADAEKLLDLLPHNDSVKYAGLVLSQGGLERALNTDIEIIHVVLAVSDAFNKKNSRRSVEESTLELLSVIREAKSANKRVVGVLGTAFGCPFEGDISEGKVLSIAEEFIKNGCDEITLADTTGLANPAQVNNVVSRYYELFKQETPLGLHFHNTRGLGLANVLSGYLAGVKNFDASIAGLGGCPFAPKAVGNVCTEDMVNMFHGMGIATNIDLDKLTSTALWMEKLIGRTLAGMIMKV